MHDLYIVFFLIYMYMYMYYTYTKYNMYCFALLATFFVTYGGNEGSHKVLGSYWLCHDGSLPPCSGILAFMFIIGLKGREFIHTGVSM